MTGWLIQSLLASAVLMAAVMAVRTWVARTWGARAAYALWLLPVARLLCPPLELLPSAPVTPVTSAGSGVTAASLDLGAILLAVWAIGAVAFLAFQLMRYHRFLSLTDAAALQAPRRIRGLHIVRSAAATGPFAAGLLRRRIVLPADFRQAYAPGERRFVLAHEAAHHRRGDLWINLAALMVLAAHWFNPLAWWAHRLFRIDQEAACDATVLASRPADRFRYGITLAKASGGLPAALCAFGDRVMLKVRLRRLAQTGAHAPVRTTFALGVGLFLAAGTALAPRPCDPASVALSPLSLNTPAPALIFPISAPATVSPNLAHPTREPGGTVPNAPSPAPSPRADTLAQVLPQASDSSPIEQRRQAGLERSRERLSADVDLLAASRGRPIGDPAYIEQRRQQALADRAAGLRG